MRLQQVLLFLLLETAEVLTSQLLTVLQLIQNALGYNSTEAINYSYYDWRQYGAYDVISTGGTNQFAFELKINDNQIEVKAL